MVLYRLHPRPAVCGAEAVGCQDALGHKAQEADRHEERVPGKELAPVRARQHGEGQADAAAHAQRLHCGAELHLDRFL